MKTILKLVLIVSIFTFLGSAIFKWLNDPSRPTMSPTNTKVWVHPALQREYIIWVKELIDNGVELDSRLIGSRVSEIDVSNGFLFDTKCVGRYYQDGRIHIHHDIVTNSDSLYLRWCLWHELGHGVLLLGHSDCNREIMAPEMGKVTLERWDLARSSYIDQAKRIIKERKLTEHYEEF